MPRYQRDNIVAGIAEEAACEGSFVAEPQFNVVLAMVIIWDFGEATPDIPFHTRRSKELLAQTNPCHTVEQILFADFVFGGNHSLVLDLPEFLLSMACLLTGCFGLLAEEETVCRCTAGDRRDGFLTRV